MAKAARRQHFLARFYLRNFAEPLFSDNLCVYDIRKRCWERRTPNGVGWFPHLCSMIDKEGNRTDEFDQFLKRHVEDPATPALKKLAMSGQLDESERSAVAFFVALTAARSPEMMKSAMTAHLESLAPIDRTKLDDLVEEWCHLTRRPFDSKSRNEFLKPGCFGAIWIWSQSLQHRLLNWQWHFVRTTRDRPFVTSDQPGFAQWYHDQDVRYVSFPVSSEVALIVIDGVPFDEGRDSENAARAINRQTIERATEFIVACNDSFPGDNFLIGRGQ
jgi:hypothetical protein